MQYQTAGGKRQRQRKKAKAQKIEWVKDIKKKGYDRLNNAPKGAWEMGKECDKNRRGKAQRKKGA